MATVALSALLGLGIRHYYRQKGDVRQINLYEYLIGLGLIMVLVGLTSWAGVAYSHAKVVGGYVEYANGNLVKANRDVVGKKGAYTRATYSLNDREGRQYAPPGFEAWKEADEKIRSGDLPPSTTTVTTVNHFLASRQTILKNYGGDIPRFRDAKLLVPHTQNYRDPLINGYMAKKVVPAGFTLNNEPAWQNTIAALGSKCYELHGCDVHMVAVLDSKVPMGEADSFAGAHLAYWQSELGKNGIAENMVVVFVGVDDAQKKVIWARAVTGLPSGNEALIAAIAFELPNTPFEPSSLLGAPTAKLVGDKVQFGQTDGLVDQIINTKYPFEPVCVRDNCGEGVFTYLKEEVYIPWWALTLIVLVSLALTVPVWMFFVRKPFFELFRPAAGSNFFQR